MVNPKNSKIIAKRKITVGNGEEQEKVKALKKKGITKKFLYVEIDDEITTIFDRIIKLKIKDIYLVVPKRALIFQSSINLKILKRKSEDLGKNIFIITHDPNGINLAKRIGITVYDKPEGHEHPALVSGKLNESNEIAPLKASVNSFEEELPSRRTDKKFSISDLVKSGRKSLRLIPKNFTLKRKEQKKKDGNAPSSSFVLIAPNKQALLTLVVISLVILLTITYIALPGATVILTPKANVVKVTANVWLADYEANRAELDTRPSRTIPSYTITTKIDKVFTYQATGKNVDQGTKATGNIQVKNLSGNDWPLVPKTRFQTANGLIFRSQNQVLIPAAKGNTPGTLTIPVVADPFDAFGQAIGERGNLQTPTTFFLPALSADNQKKLFAENTENFSGGVTKVIKFISKDDIEAAKIKMISDLKASSQAELEMSIAKRNESQKTNLLLLNCKDGQLCRDLIQMSDPQVMIQSNLEGQKLDNFSVKGSMVVSGIAYAKDDLISILKTELKLKKNPEKRLVKVDEESIDYKVVDADKSSQKVKITPTIQGLEEFELSPDKENGDRLIKKIKDAIVGKDSKEAKEFIHNLPEIENVEINSWPAWAPNLPSVPDNIKIEIKHDDSPLAAT